jgi:hypothetical protein
LPQIKVLTVNGRRYRTDTKSLTTMEELEAEGWRLSTPKIAKSLIERGLVRVTKGKGEPCKQGETAAKDDCIPTSGEGGKVSRPSNRLTTPQSEYKQKGTKARAFKDWFGDWESNPGNCSKVVDENGKPLVVYHGTSGDFDEFKSDTANDWSKSLGFDTYFFSEGKAVASTYANQFEDGKILPVYLNIRNPLVIDVDGGEWPDAISMASDRLRTYRTLVEKKYLEVMSEYEDKYAYELQYEPDSIPEEETKRVQVAARDLQDHILENKKLYREAKKHPYKYDGIIVKNVLDMTAARVSDEEAEGGYSPYTTVHIAFKPNQIKSVDNLGTFDQSSNIKKGVDKAGGKCGVGQNPKRDHCIPASSSGSVATGEGAPPDMPGKPHRIAQEATGSKIRAVGRFVSRTFLEGLSAFIKGKGKALDTATRFRDAGYEKLSTKMQKRVDRVWGAVKYIEHKVMIGFSKGRQLAEESARERGLSRESVDKLGKVLSTIDVISAWTVNMPVTLVATGSMTAAKVASWVPVASLSYVAYSTSRNPLATIRAAKSLMKKGKGKEGVKMVRGITVKGNDYRRDEVADALASGMQKAGDQLDWYLALVSSALDEMPEQPLEAIRTADEIFSKSPAPGESDSEIGEEDIESLDFGSDIEEVVTRPINRLNSNGNSN